jgi:hypothetical protein
VEFGQEELRAALAFKNLKLRITTEISLDPPEAFRIEPSAGGGRVTGGDLRGLMYGLIEAADQIRATGRLKATRATPAAKLRGVRLVLSSEDLARPRASSEAYWTQYFRMLARARINRFNLVLPRAHESWLRRLPQVASEYGVDFAFGLLDPPPAEGELHAFLSGALTAAPLIRGVEFDVSDPASGHVLGGVFRALREAGHRVTLDLREAAQKPELAKAALDAGVPVRLPSNGGCSGTFCAAGPGYEMYAELAGDSPAEIDAVRARIAALMADGLAGFSIAAPRSQLGGDPAAEAALFTLWGRLGHDSKYQFPAPPPARAK